MIITCPNCSARYKVKDELVQTKGKRVKCKKCEAVFLTYPDRDAVLESMPPSAPSVETPMPIAQATVKVDRSQLDKFLQNNAMDGTQSTVKVDPDNFKKFLDEQKPTASMAAGATVQVDRSQIDAFLKGSQSAPSASETVQLDAATLSHMALGGPELNTAQTIAMPRPTFTDAAATAPLRSSAPATPQVPAFTKAEEPSFPSDEELGIADDNFGAAPTPASTATSIEPPVASMPSAPQSAPPPAAEKMYQVQVEGQVYPNLPLDAIARWVREERLLEQDLVALNGTQDYRLAESYPEIRRYFDELDASQPAPPPAKKGFFARLFSFGK